MSDNAKWFTSTIIAGIALLISLYVAFITNVNNKKIAVSQIKEGIITAIYNLDLKRAEILIEHVLRPLDEPINIESFKLEIIGLLSEQAPKGPLILEEKVDNFSKNYKGILPGSSVYIADEKEDFKNLVEEFSGPQRLVASNKLIDLYKYNKLEVIGGLVDGIREADEEDSYRINLYILYTLARIAGGWSSSKEQYNIIIEMKNIRYSNEPTFKKRYEQAMSNYIADVK